MPFEQRESVRIHYSLHKQEQYEHEDHTESEIWKKLHHKIWI